MNHRVINLAIAYMVVRNCKMSVYLILQPGVYLRLCIFYAGDHGDDKEAVRLPASEMPVSTHHLSIQCYCLHAHTCAVCIQDLDNSLIIVITVTTISLQMSVGYS